MPPQTSSRRYRLGRGTRANNLIFPKALLRTIPQINAATTQKEYKVAVFQLLKTLKDANTRVITTEKETLQKEYHLFEQDPK